MRYLSLFDGIEAVADYLDILYRGKPAADGNKYRALGNSMAVPCMSWIGKRIAAVSEIVIKAERAEA